MVTKVFIIVGPSQTGKSTLINFIANEKIAEVGNGDGRSVTSEIKQHTIRIHENLQYQFIDCMGFGDSDLAATDPEIGEKIYKKILDQENLQIAGFLLFESLSSCSYKFHYTYSLLKAFFNECEKSILVIGSKSDVMMSRKKQEIRIKQLQDDAHLNQMKFIIWSNFKSIFNEKTKEIEECEFEEGERKLKLNKLTDLLNSLAPYNSKDLLKYNLILKPLAEQILKDHTKITTTEEMQKYWDEFTVEVDNNDKNRLYTLTTAGLTFAGLITLILIPLPLNLKKAAATTFVVTAYQILQKEIDPEEKAKNQQQEKQVKIMKVEREKPVIKYQKEVIIQAQEAFSKARQQLVDIALKEQRKKLQDQILIEQQQQQALQKSQQQQK